MRKTIAICLVLLILLALCVVGVYADPELGESPENAATEATVPTETEPAAETTPEPETETETEPEPEPETEAAPETEPVEEVETASPVVALTIYCDDSRNAHWFTVERVFEDGSVGLAARFAILPGEGMARIYGLPVDVAYRITDQTVLNRTRSLSSSARTMSFTPEDLNPSVVFPALSGTTEWLSDTASATIVKGG